MIYALGSMVVEITVVRLALMGMVWITGKKKIFRVLEFMTALLFLMAAGSFIAAYKMTGFSNAIPTSSANLFWTGALLSATNPLHIPFWMGWSTVLINKEILQPVAAQYNFYVSGIGLGTILGFMLFIYGGNYFVSQLTNH